MAEYQTMRARGVGVSAAEIDQGLRAHMNKVYGTMSIGMLITFAAAWALSNLSVTTDPSQAAVQLEGGLLLTGLGAAIYTTPLSYVIMFAPLIFVFGFSAMMNRMSAATAQTVFYAFAAVMGLSLSSIFLVFTGVSIIPIRATGAQAAAAGQSTSRSVAQPPSRQGAGAGTGSDSAL